MTLRIAMLGHKRIPSREGGVEIVVAELSSRMVQKGHSVTCYNRRGHHISGKKYDVEQSKEYNGVTLKSVFTVQKRGLAAMSSSFFAAISCAIGRYDVVHFHAEGPCAMLWLPKLFGKKCIATIHGLDHQRAKWGRFASWYLRMGEKCAAKYSDHLIVLSRNAENYFMEKYGRKSELIPNGVMLPDIKDANLITDEFGLHRDEYILFLGRIVPEKGLCYLVEAYKKVNTDKKLVIAGGSSDTAAFEGELKAMAANDPRIIFTGFVQGRMLEELYSNAYVYVLPSDLEGMPLSLLEAMSYGNCVLTSDIPECTEIVEDKGMTFKRSDIDDLTERLQLLCDSPDTVDGFKRVAVEHVIKNHSWDEVVTKTLSLYGDDGETVTEISEKETHESFTR